MARYVIKWNERQNDAELVQQKKKKKEKEYLKEQHYQAKLKVK